MSLDLVSLKRRRNLMMALSGTFLLAALASFVIYFEFGQGWARFTAAAALVVCCGAQVWFIASVRRLAKGE